MYEIRIMENEEFDALPYAKAKESLGMADAKTGVAYVRKTGVAGLDANTINHEFDELLQSVSPHEEDGIRYKSGGSLGKWLAPVLGFALAPFTAGMSIPWAVPALAGAGLAAGTGAHSRSVKPEKYGQNTFGSVLTDAAVGGLGGYGGGVAGAGFSSGFSGSSGGLFSKLGAGLKGAVGLPTSSAASTGAGAVAGQPASGLGARFAQGAAQKTGTQLASAAGGFTPSALSAAGTQAVNKAGTSLFSKAGNYLKSNAGGLAANTMVSSLSPTQNQPISGAGQGVQGGNALSLFGGAPKQSTNQSAFTAPYGQEDVDKGLGNIQSQYQKQYQSIFDTFRRAQPGSTPEGNQAFATQLASAKQGLGSTTDDFYSGINQANDDAYTQYRYNGVKNTNNLSDSQMNEYISLASQPDSVIRGRFPGMKAADFRDIFSGLA